MGRTATALGASEPQWPPGVARAFLLPILHPNSDVYFGLLDAEGAHPWPLPPFAPPWQTPGHPLRHPLRHLSSTERSSLPPPPPPPPFEPPLSHTPPPPSPLSQGEGPQLDMPLGRVVISLGGIHPRTIYDAWFPLQRKAPSNHSTAIDTAYKLPGWKKLEVAGSNSAIAQLVN